MDYFRILNLKKEPFSNSPDPDYFFRSRQHLGCLQKLELSLRLRRGLNVVIGDVGTGKTTLCRELIRNFATDDEIETHLILDPAFSNSSEFLSAVAEMFEGDKPPDDSNDWQIKEIIKQHLFRKGVDEKKTVILIIDEGQKIPVFCLEILREFLNYETNDYKLLQIAIFAQREFEKTIEEHANVADRINLFHFLEPMNFKDTRLMIQFRLQQSSETRANISLFTYPALWATYRATGGFPRKIVNLCHQSILAMIVQNRSKVGLFLVRSCIKRAFSKGLKRWRQVITAAFLVGLVIAVLIPVFAPERLKMRMVQYSKRLVTSIFQNDTPQHNSTETKIEDSLKKVQRNSTQSSQMSLNKPSPEPEVKVSTNTNLRKAVKTVPEAFNETYYKDSKYPAILGQVAVKRLETIGGMIQKIYGVYDFRYLDFVKKANPHLSDPNDIDVDDVISFPTIPAKIKSFKENAWWLEIGEKDNLEAAFNLIRSYPKDAPPVRLIPYWDNLLGLKFSVLLKEYFLVETFAINRLNDLPPRIALKGKILSKWDENTVFFANPF